MFVTYDQEQHLLQIEPNFTTADNIGEYPIDVQLIDINGVLSQKLTIQLKIIPIETETKESSQEASNETVSLK